MRPVTCAFCGKEAQAPALVDDGEIVDTWEDGQIFRSRRKDGQLLRSPEPIPIYHADCFQAAFGKGREGEPSPPIT
jgi:hypothetical protein